MKKTKFAYLLSLITDPNPGEEYENGRVVNRTRVVDISFLMALENPMLVMAMMEQLDHGFLRLTGTYDQWKVFFANKWEMLLHWGGDLMTHN